MSKQFYFKQFSLALSTQFSSSWPIERILSGATTQGQSGPGNDSNEGVLHIPQSSRITRASLSDCLVSYLGHLFGGGVLLLCRDIIGVFSSPPLPFDSQLGNYLFILLAINHSG